MPDEKVKRLFDVAKSFSYKAAADIGPTAPTKCMLDS